MDTTELKNFLDEKYIKYNNLGFIETDPVSIPHQFSRKEDIEIAAFLSATIAWGQRTTIIRNGNQLMDLMEREPFMFLTQNSLKSSVGLKLLSTVLLMAPIAAIL